jgi:hypothetical protein
MKHWLTNCSQNNTDVFSCSKCDWWPARSSAPWYYDVLDESVTCGNYFSADGARLFNNGSTSYPCGQHPGYVLNSSAVAETLVSSQFPAFNLCCYFQATCGLAYTNGSAYQCNSTAGRIADVTRSSSAAPAEEICCKAFVSTCVAAFINGTAHQCPTVGTYQLVNPSSTTVDDVTCCKFVPTCSAAYRSGASFECPTGYSPRSGQSEYSPPSINTCCKPDVMTADLLCLNATQEQPSSLIALDGCPNPDGQCCYQSTCGAVIMFNESSFLVTGVASYECPGGMMRNASTDGIANLTAEDCGCYEVTCGQYFPNDTAYACSPGYVYNPAVADEPAVYGDTTCCVSCRSMPCCSLSYPL